MDFPLSLPTLLLRLKVEPYVHIRLPPDSQALNCILYHRMSVSEITRLWSLLCQIAEERVVSVTAALSQQETDKRGL